jgi:hypothetical protein
MLMIMNEDSGSLLSYQDHPRSKGFVPTLSRLPLSEYLEISLEGLSLIAISTSSCFP